MPCAALCYRLIDGRLHFAERADALAALAPVAEHDPQAIFDYLYFHVIPSPRTIFHGVFRLPPAHCALFEGGQLSVTPYWSPLFEPASGAGFRRAGRRVPQHLLEAVRRQLDGSKPACFLSGGTDSSTVAGMIGEAAGRPAATYSIGFEAEGYDEMAFARIAAKHFGTEHHEYYVTPDDLVRSIPAVAAHYDQPFGNSSALPAYYCAKMARDDGVTRMLAGDGGDELFGGNTPLCQAARLRLVRQRARPAAQRPAGTAAGTHPAGRAAAVHARAAATSNRPRCRCPTACRCTTCCCAWAWTRCSHPTSWPRWIRRTRCTSSRLCGSGCTGSSALNRMLAYDWRYTLAEADLPKVCGSTQLAGVTVGFPFLDQQLVDFSLRLPTDYKLKGLKLRWFFKEALRGFLPDEILTKKKQGFGLPFGVWANRHAALNDFAHVSLLSLASRGIIRTGFVRTLLNELLPQHPGYYGEMVWILMMLEQWLQKYDQ